MYCVFNDVCGECNENGDECVRTDTNTRIIMDGKRIANAYLTGPIYDFRYGNRLNELCDQAQKGSEIAKNLVFMEVVAHS